MSKTVTKKNKLLMKLKPNFSNTKAILHLYKLKRS